MEAVAQERVFSSPLDKGVAPAVKILMDAGVVL